MDINQNQNKIKKKTIILIFIQKITPKNMQELILFLQRNDFSFKRIIKKSKQRTQKESNLSFANSNFILECNSEVSISQLKDIIFFLNQHTLVNCIFFENKILNPFARLLELSNTSKINF